MKLWEILKSENLGKTYKCSNNDKYKLFTNEDNELYLGKENDIKPKQFTQNEMMSLDFDEIKELTGWEKQREDETFYFIDYDGIIEDDNGSDLNCYNNYNCFSTKEKAEEVNKEQLLYRMMKKFYDENDGNVNFNDSECNYHISYNKGLQSFEIDWGYDHFGLHSIYFSTYQLAKRCFEEIVKPFYKKYYGGKFNR
ncbi:UNVERIFIED_ORG: hypothetical protein B2H93_04295 [Clostridium botulinum]